MSPFTDEVCTPYKKFEVSFEDDHQKALECLQKSSDADLHVHCQLTQPKRRRKLLVDSVNTFLMSEPDVVATYVSWRNDYSWREIRKYGDKFMFDKNIRSSDRKSFYDGALYVAKDLTNIFNTDLRWDWVYNYTGPVVDVDYREDIENNLGRIEK